MGFLAWIVSGLIAGWLAGTVMKGGGYVCGSGDSCMDYAPDKEGLVQKVRFYKGPGRSIWVPGAFLGWPTGLFNPEQAQIRGRTGTCPLSLRPGFSTGQYSNLKRK